MQIKARLSAALHNLISNRPPKTERLLSLFLITVISLMSVAMLSVMSEGLKADLSKHYLESTEQKAINLAHQIERFIETRRIQLEAQAHHSIVQQTIMQPTANTGLLNDFLKSQTIIGKVYPQKIYDFKGDKLFCSSLIHEQHELLNIKRYDNTQVLNKYQSLYKNSSDFKINLSDNLKYWEIALPIRYGASVEGVFVTYIPLTEMTHALDLNNIIDLRISATTANDNTIAWGAKNSLPLKKITPGPSNIQLAYGIDISSLTNSFSIAKTRLIISSIIIALFAIGFAIIMGRWFFVRPIERLQSFTSELSKGADPHLKKTKRITIEIQQLSDQITDMAKKIQQREQSLIDSNEALKHNQNTLVHAEKMAGLGQVTAGVAHEINNPIGFIMNNLTMLKEYHSFLKTLVAQLLSMKEKLSEEEQNNLAAELSAITNTLQNEDLDFVINDLDCITSESITGAERVKEITQGLKGYAYSGEKASLININECIESTLKMVWNELKYHCVVDKSLGDIPQIECIGGQINQVLMNLFINAAHAMEGQNGRLSLQTQQLENNILITVEDKGSGIEAHNLKHVFDPFFTTKPVGEGTGLCMSICYFIIKKL